MYNHTVFFNAIMRAVKDRQRTVVVGHFYFPAIIYADKIAYVNVIREPVERCISEHNFMIQKHHTKGAVELVDSIANRDWWNCLACKPETLLHYFCGHDDGPCPGLPRRDKLECGWANIQQNYYIGMTHDIDNFTTALEKLFPSLFQGLSLTLPPEPVNKQIKHVTVSMSTKEKIRKVISPEEFELYNRIEKGYGEFKKEMKRCELRG